MQPVFAVTMFFENPGMIILICLKDINIKDFCNFIRYKIIATWNFQSMSFSAASIAKKYT